MALPFLDAMTPAFAAPRTVSGEAPRRLAFAYVPNGIIMDAYRPATFGTGYEFTAARTAGRSKTVAGVDGLTHNNRPFRRRAWRPRSRSALVSHRRSPPRATEGADMPNSISIGQVAANTIGATTRFASLELGSELDECPERRMRLTATVASTPRTPSRGAATSPDPPGDQPAGGVRANVRRWRTARGPAVPDSPLTLYRRKRPRLRSRRHASIRTATWVRPTGPSSTNTSTQSATSRNASPRPRPTLPRSRRRWTVPTASRSSSSATFT